MPRNPRSLDAGPAPSQGPAYVDSPTRSTTGICCWIEWTPMSGWWGASTTKLFHATERSPLPDAVHGSMYGVSAGPTTSVGYGTPAPPAKAAAGIPVKGRTERAMPRNVSAGHRESHMRDARTTPGRVHLKPRIYRIQGLGFTWTPKVCRIIAVYRFGP